MTSGFKIGPLVHSMVRHPCISRGVGLMCASLQNKYYCMRKVRPKYSGSVRCAGRILRPLATHPNILNGSFGQYYQVRYSQPPRLEKPGGMTKGKED